VIDGHTQLVGLIGWPVEHSLSPVMHNAAFAALGLNWRYVPLRVPPGQVEMALRGLTTLGLRGANVTVPYKQAVMRHLDEITAAAQTIGAVNTIVVREGRLIGHNTDGDGFLAALRESDFKPDDRRALVLGAGGAARAVVYVLAQAGCTVTIHNRTVQRAAELAHAVRRSGVRTPVTWMPMNAEPADLDPAHFDLLVNTTPVGMWPNVDASPWPEALPLPAHWTVFDLVYNPLKTHLLQQARASGAHPIAGLGMLVWQGSLAFELWTGQAAPVEVMRVACERVLAG
jgi:shikimate dehydrogenase